MASTTTAEAERMIEEIRQALADHSPLTADQRADIDRLCEEIRVSHRMGKIQEASSAQHLAMSIIYQGAPAPE
jgi:hypothetical protein